MMAHVLLHCKSLKWPRVSGGRPDFNFDHGPLILRNLLNINRCLKQHT